MHIKICGITNINDALQAVQAGATHLGIIFVENSPRYVKAEEARRIVEAVQKTALVVGVFQNHRPEVIAEMAVQTGIDAMQLHGDEDPAFCRSIALRLGKAVIKTIILQADKQTATKQPSLIETIATCTPYREQVTYLLFDKAKGHQSQDWLAEALAQVVAIEREKDSVIPPYFFAGGLTVDNVEHVLDTMDKGNLAGLVGLDVASGVESSSGKKDAALVSAFIAKAKNKTTPGVC